MAKRTPFPGIFWIANAIEILERFAYYGIYVGFGIYMQHLGYTRAQLGIVQSLFLVVSYVTPVVSGTFADRFGFKKVCPAGHSCNAATAHWYRLKVTKKLLKDLDSLVPA